MHGLSLDDSAPVGFKAPLMDSPSNPSAQDKVKLSPFFPFLFLFLCSD